MIIAQNTHQHCRRHRLFSQIDDRSQYESSSGLAHANCYNAAMHSPTWHSAPLRGTIQSIQSDNPNTNAGAPSNYRHQSSEAKADKSLLTPSSLCRSIICAGVPRKSFPASSHFSKRRRHSLGLILTFLPKPQDLLQPGCHMQPSE